MIYSCSAALLERAAFALWHAGRPKLPADLPATELAPMQRGNPKSSLEQGAARHSPCTALPVDCSCITESNSRTAGTALAAEGYAVSAHNRCRTFPTGHVANRSTGAMEGNSSVPPRGARRGDTVGDAVMASLAHWRDGCSRLQQVTRVPMSRGDVRDNDPAF